MAQAWIQPPSTLKAATSTRTWTPVTPCTSTSSTPTRHTTNTWVSDSEQPSVRRFLWFEPSLFSWMRGVIVVEGHYDDGGCFFTRRSRGHLREQWQRTGRLHGHHQRPGFVGWGTGHFHGYKRRHRPVCLQPRPRRRILRRVDQLTLSVLGLHVQLMVELSKVGFCLMLCMKTWKNRGHSPSFFF